jgi:hypothetical protein
MHTLSRIEASNLNNIVTLGPLKLIHFLLRTQAPELAHVELGVPWVQVLVETVKPERTSIYGDKSYIRSCEPVSGSTEESELLNGHVAWDELINRVTFEGYY